MASRKKFEIYKDGERVKLDVGNMIVLNQQGLFFVLTGMGDYYLGFKSLYDHIGYYEVVWKE